MDKKKIEITRVFHAPIEAVWDAWTNADNLKQWKCPEGMIAPEVDVDLSIGGKYRVVMEGNGRKETVGGEYLTIEKPHKLVYTWLWEGAPKETHTTKVSLLFKELPDHKTELTLLHTGFADDNMVTEHNQGWESTLKKLQIFLSSRSG